MNLDPTNDQNSQWEIDRYLLDDPTLDRDAFEQRMLDDLALAEQVAASVADLLALSSAAQTAAVSHGAVTPLTSLSSSHRSAYGWAMLVSSVVLLIALSAWQLRKTSKEDQLSQIADNWVAFENLTIAESLDLVATDERSNDDQSIENQTDTEQADWLVEAAREFYLAKNEETAG